MKFNSKFNIGQKVWCAIPKHMLNELTVGKIIIELTDSPGIEGEDLFDNYKPQKGYVEKYMCIETGIGSGSLWELDKNLFGTKEEAEKVFNEDQQT